MTSTDSNGSSSDVPKRSKKHHIGKKQILYIVLPLLLINAGIAHTIIGQIKIKANASVTEVKDDTTVLANEGEVADDTAAQDEIVADDQPVITIYKVKSGDTLSGIADKFNISINTIRWANDLTEKTSKIAIGDELVILPVTGVEYKVKKGDTLSGIALKFDASQDDILKYNDIEAGAIKIGTELIIPNAEPITAPAKAPAKVVAKTPIKPTATKSTTTTTTKTSSETANVATTDTKEKEDDKKSEDEEKPAPTKTTYVNPIPAGVLTQRIHDGNAVDFGAAIGTPVKASAAGTVIIAKAGNNGGYGTYIVITHADGSQTLYGHLSKLSVAAGDKVDQGETIGLSGNTGKSTGPHLHFKIINGPRNPFASLALH